MEIRLDPGCSTCRPAVAELEAAGVEYAVGRYLDDPPTAAELGEVVARLGLEPWGVARAEEERAIQRPIITAADGTTVVARDEDSRRRVLDAEA
jgi:arsenate reductase (glutaredoxin)